MVVMNDLDRFHLVMDVIDRVPGLANSAAWLRQQMTDTRARHHAWVREHGEDLPEVQNWVWPGTDGQPVQPAHPWAATRLEAPGPPGADRSSVPDDRDRAVC